MQLYSLFYTEDGGNRFLRKSGINL